MFDLQRNGALKGRGTESVPETEGLPADSALWFQDVVGRAEGALTCLQGASPRDISPPVSSALLSTLEEPRDKRAFQAPPAATGCCQQTWVEPCSVTTRGLGEYPQLCSLPQPDWQGQGLEWIPGPSGVKVRAGRGPPFSLSVVPPTLPLPLQQPFPEGRVLAVITLY